MIKKILVPVDGSYLAEQAIPYAEELAHKFEADLLLARVMQPVTIFGQYDVEFYSQELERQRHEAEKYLQDLRQTEKQQHINSQAVVIEGKPVAEALIDLACEQNTDLIVMSTHGRSGIGRWVYGSVANKVLQHAPCPVYLVRAKENPN